MLEKQQHTILQATHCSEMQRPVAAGRDNVRIGSSIQELARMCWSVQQGGSPDRCFAGRTAAGAIDIGPGVE